MPGYVYCNIAYLSVTNPDAATRRTRREQTTQSFYSPTVNADSSFDEMDPPRTCAPDENAIRLG
jgi:hypothetical protein